MMIEGALADGTFISSPAEEWVEGVEIYVMDAEGNPQPLADGEYTLDNGKMIVVSEGKIASIKEMEVEEEVKIEVEAEVTEQSVEETYSKDQVEALLNNVISEFSTKLSAIEEKLSVAEAKVVELSQAPAVAPVKQRAAVKTEQPIQLNQIQNTAERARAIVAKYTK
jgi:DNA repair exonuclease SbcCD nuclease subunit